MSPYTRESLQNVPDNRSLWLRESDVEKVNRLITAMANVRSGEPVPTDGDRIICVCATGEQVSDNGYLECREGRLMICSKPYYHIYLGDHLDGEIYTTCSGGPWTGYMTSQEFLERAEYQGKTTARFWTRGSGTCGVHFEAEVHLWRYTSKKGF